MEINEDTTTRRKYKIFQGKPSYHQMKAGHSYAGSIVIEATKEELNKHTENLRWRDCPYQVLPIEE